MTDWMITIPKTVPWRNYQDELDDVSEQGLSMFYRVPYKPKCQAGDRMFVVYDGKVRGWMEIVDIKNTTFQCLTTGKDWPQGWYIERAGEWHPVDGPEVQGFRGVRKYCG